jgi:hypothetical protein
MKRYGRPAIIVTDRLRAYGAAMKVLGNVERQDCGRCHIKSDLVKFADNRQFRRKGFQRLSLLVDRSN